MQSVLQNLPVGWRFQPTNEELLDHYLKNKRLGLPVHGSDIEDIKICDFDPWDLIDKNSASKERYLFCRREFHLKTGGTQRKRKAKGGFWKRTGQIVHITRDGDDDDEVIGTKTIFVYHDPNPTEFVIHEFELDDSSFQDDNDFVLCKLMIIKKKKAIKKLKKVGSLSEKKVGINPEKIESDCSKNKPNKRARKHVSYCDTASFFVSNNGQEEEIIASSAYDEGEPSSHLPLDSENQTPSVMTATSTCEKGGSSHQGACDFEYQMKYEMNNTSIYNKDIFLMDSDLDNQNSIEISNLSRYSMSETSSRKAADLENQIQNDINTISLHETSSSWFGGQNPGEISAVSTHKNVETSSLVNFDFENSNQNETISDWSSKEGEPSYPVPLDFGGNQNPGEITAVSTNESVETSYLVSFDSGNSNQNQTISDWPCKQGERSYPVALGFGNQNPSKETNKSSSIEGSWSLLQETPLDFGKQNQYEKTDMSDSDFWRSLLASSVLETNYEEVESRCKKTDTSNLDDLGDATFPEINSEMLDELTVFDDLLDTLFSEPPEPLN